MGIRSKSNRTLNSAKMTRSTRQAIKGKQSLASLIQRVVNDKNSDPITDNGFLQDHLAFYVKTQLTLANIMRANSHLPVNVKLTGQDSYVNLDAAFENGIEIGVAHQRPKFGEKSVPERLVCQYGYLEHEISHLKFGNPEIWTEMLRFAGLSQYGWRPTADPNIFDLDNIQLIKYIFNILADGHDETRAMMINRRNFLKTIVAKDEIIGNYKFDAKETNKNAPDDMLGQIIGNLLMHVLPNKATYEIDDTYMDDKAKQTLDKLIPYADKAVEGTYEDIFESSKQIYLILQTEGYLPKTDKQQRQMQQMLQQFAQNNPDAFRQMLQQGQQAGGGQGGQGQGVGGGSAMTIQLPNSRSDEVPDGEGNQKGQQGQDQGQGQRQGQDDNKKSSGGDKEGEDGEDGDGQGQGKGSGSDGEGNQQVTAPASGTGHQYNTPGGVGGPSSGGAPRFVGKQEAEKAKQEAIKTARTNQHSASKAQQNLAQQNIETEQMKQYTGTKVVTPTVTVEHLRQNLTMIRESQKEIQNMKKLLKERLKLGQAPKEIKRQRFGRLDRRSFVRADETESDLIFKRKLHLPSPKARIYMIGDMSGSMGDDQIYAQAKAMTISAEAAKSLNIPVEVSFFTGAGYGNSIYMAKTFNQKNGVISLGIDRGTIPSGRTPTAEAIDSAAKRMVEDGFTSQEEQKIMYVMTDGAPNNAAAVKQTIEELGKKHRGRVRVIGVFMKTHQSDSPPATFFQSFDTPYSEAVVVDSIDKVPDDFTRVLMTIMRKRKFQ